MMTQPIRATSHLPPLTRRRALQGAAGLGGAAVLAWSETGPARAAEADPGATPPVPTPSNVWPITGNDSVDFETRFGFGETAYGAGEFGELVATVDQIGPAPDLTKDPVAFTTFITTYVNAFVARGNIVRGRALAARQAGHRVSARSQFLRASSYYNLALFFVLGTSDRAKEADYYRLTQDCWAAYTELADESYQRVDIPWNGTTFPGYLVRPAGIFRRRPTVIVTNGSDAQYIDVYAFGVAAALERGYNVFVYEGPGQGSMLFERQIPVTPDWGSVVTPIVNYLSLRPEVDRRKIGLTGWSLGGNLAMRAAAAEPRLAAVVSDPGALNLLKPYQDGLPSVFGPHVPDPQAVWSGGTSAYVQKTPALQFSFAKRSELFGAAFLQDARAGTVFPDVTPFIQALTAFTITDAQLAAVRTNALVIKYDADTFFGNQPEEMFGKLTNAASKTLYEFTTSEGAGEHCAPMAPQRRNEVVYDWMDSVLG